MFSPPISEEAIKNVFHQVRKHFTAKPKIAIAGFKEAGKTSLFTVLYGEDAEKLLRLLGMLEDLDDVQEVFSNADFPDELLQQQAG